MEEEEQQLKLLNATIISGCNLIKSNEREKVIKGIGLLEEIIVAAEQQQPLIKNHTDQLMLLTESQKQFCFYYLALANYQLRQYITSKKYISLVLTKHPNHQTAVKLKELLDNEIQKGTIYPQFKI